MSKINLSFNDINEQYLKAKNSIGICNEHNKCFYMMQGSNCLKILNHYSHVKIKENDISKMFPLYKHNKFLDEVIAVKLNSKKYLIIGNENKVLEKLFFKIKKKFITTSIDDVTNIYSLFSFHGKKAYNYFKNLKSSYLFKVNHQGYVYYNLICTKNDATKTLNYFLDQKFYAISLETRAFFMYNNKVLLNFNGYKHKYRKIIINTIFKNQVKRSNYTLELFETVDLCKPSKNNVILDCRKRKCGFVCLSYKLPTKKTFFVLGLVNTSNNSILIIKDHKKEILVRKLYKQHETL